MKPLGTVIALIYFTINMTVAQPLQPYLLCAESTESLETVQAEIKKVLQDYSFQMIGEYSPAYAPSTTVMAITSPDLVDAVREVGGITGVTSSWRLMVKQEGDKVQISYPNPEYWGNAYFEEDFTRVEFSRYMAISGKLSQLGGSVGTLVETGFGSEKGIYATDLQKLRKQAEITEETELLKSFDSYEEAILTIDSNFKAADLTIDALYNIELPEKKMKLYGFGLKADSDGNSLISEKEQPNIEYLPVEVMVRDGEVHMLSSQFIVPMVFPDQSTESLKGVMEYYKHLKEMIKPVLVSLKD